MQQSLHNMTCKTGQSIDHILQSSAVLASENSVLSVEAQKSRIEADMQQEQSAAIATASEEISQTVADIARNCDVASETSGKVLKLGEKGKEALRVTMDHIGLLSDTSEKLASMINQLDAKTENVGEIIGLIEDIADQTNLLALNAAIEAARAGNAGRGFSVVAEEVRKLAEKTMQATGRITTTITSIQKEARDTSESTEKAVREIKESHESMIKTQSILTEIVDAVQDSSEQITQITAAVNEQTTATEEIAANIHKISDSARAISNHGKNLLSGINKTSGIIADLNSSLGHFRIDPEPATLLELTKADHRFWVQRLYKMVYGEERIAPKEMTDHHQCRLGKWYFGEGKDICGVYGEFIALDSPHKQLHEKARLCIERFNAGDLHAAETLLGEIEEISHDVVGLLDELKRHCLGQAGMAETTRMPQSVFPKETDRVLEKTA
ncbi:MAG: hypothetical protein GXP58_05280 [Deltaproteobacteria bacterium]|nr:hypothetical protein [Deltaproteobacteria bacterium]